MERCGGIELRFSRLQEPLGVVERIRRQPRLVVGRDRILGGQASPRLGKSHLRRDDQRPGKLWMVRHFGLLQRRHRAVDQIPRLVQCAAEKRDAGQRDQDLGPNASRLFLRVDQFRRRGELVDPVLCRAWAILREALERGFHGSFGKCLRLLEIGRGPQPLARRLPLPLGRGFIGRLLRGVVGLPPTSPFRLVFRGGGIGIE